MDQDNLRIDFENPISNNDNESNVYKAINIQTKKEYAIKKIDLSVNIDEEISIYEKLNSCENSIKYYGTFMDAESKYILMELCDYSLAKKLNDKKLDQEYFSVKDIKEIFSELNTTFNIMRENNIIHGNLKPENILAKTINAKLIYKISDYGKSKQKDKEKVLKYQAPEYNNPLIQDKSKVDLWSIGMILYELHFGVLPKLPINKNTLMKSDSEFFDDLIRKLLVKDPFKTSEEKESENEEDEEEEIRPSKEVIRISWDEYFNHEFFKNDYIKEMISLKSSFNNFKNEVKKIIGYINEKYKMFKASIIKEEDEFCSNEYNNKIKIFAQLLDQYKFNNNEQDLMKFFELTKQSIMNDNIVNEYVEFSNTEIMIYKGEVKKGTKIKNGKGKELYINGEIKYEGDYKDDKREGNGCEYTEEGEVIFKGEYKEGKQWNGNKKVFDDYEDENGQIKKYVKLKVEVKNGKICGKCKEFDFEGNMIYEGEYQNEKRHGNGKEYTNNNIDFEGEFKEGKRWNGIANQFNMNGKVVYDCTYQNGKIFNGKEYKYFDDEIKLRTEAEYKEGLLWNAKGYNKKSVFSNIDFEISNGNGVMKDYYSDNVLKSVINYKNGRKNGKAISYYNIEGEKIEYEGEYNNDIKNGEWKCFYENGNKEFIGNYTNGIKNGPCKEYDKGGKLLFDGEYNNGLKWTGKERLTKDVDNKKIFIERKYNNGKADCVEYYEHSKFSPKLFELKGLEFIQKLIKEGHDKKDLSQEINYETYITDLLFVGEYIDDNAVKDKRNRNGKGFEYHDNKFVFEGEYKNGIIVNGKGKIYDNKGNIIFNGEYINGKRNGHVYEYYDSTETKFDTNISSEKISLLKYEGKYIDDEKNGLGKEYSYDESTQIITSFEGIYKDGKKWEGVGKEFYQVPDKLLFDGEYKEGKRWNGNFIEYSNIMGRIKLKGKYSEGKRINVKKNKEFENSSLGSNF